MCGTSRSGATALLLAGCAVAIAACSGGSSGAKPPADSSGNPPVMSPVAEHGQLAVVGTQLRDQAGKPVQLKGVSSQWLNYESKTFPESKSAISWARDNWKLSVIRAAMGVDIVSSSRDLQLGSASDFMLRSSAPEPGAAASR